MPRIENLFPPSDIIIKLCKSNVYLGAIFTADGSTVSLSAHAKEKNDPNSIGCSYFSVITWLCLFVLKELFLKLLSIHLFCLVVRYTVSFRKMEVIYMSAI